MTLYQLLKENETMIYQFVKVGILSYTIIRDIGIYENYLQLDKINKESKYLLLAEDFEIGYKRIQQIILNMEKRI